MLPEAFVEALLTLLRYQKGNAGGETRAALAVLTSINDALAGNHDGSAAGLVSTVIGTNF